LIKLYCRLTGQYCHSLIRTYYLDNTVRSKWLFWYVRF
jgi:hypothetical protein